ncbi:MAG: GTP 3',8-cyclase MoaA [Dehalococcoidales bacterium]|nr:MAG: GTP 3',8-cyclase MoaA [Dehalococcoidales bacterium]
MNETQQSQENRIKHTLYDAWHRQVNYLRISVTDHCNLNCIYCSVNSMLPLKHEDILSYEEIATLVRASADMGINKVRLTGGEPLMRPHFTTLVRMIAEIDGIDDISMTSNGILLARYAEELKAAGLNRVNISLDTLKADRFKKITGHDKLKDVLAGIEAAHRAGLTPVKINMVPFKGINDDEIIDFARMTIDNGWNVRYIEFMPIGTPNGDISGMVTTGDIRELIQPLGELEPYTGLEGNGPARYYQFPGSKGSIGFITPITEHFCHSCNRLRVTSDGNLRPCLLANEEISIKDALRSGAGTDDLKELIQKAVNIKREQHNLDGRLAPDTDDRPMCQIGG